MGGPLDVRISRQKSGAATCLMRHARDILRALDGTV
jgi:hypothetical protein